MDKAILNLFKSYIPTSKSVGYYKKGLKYGLVVPKSASREILNLAIDIYGKKGEQLNSTFHKSFKTVKTSDEVSLLLQQIYHYLTVYICEERNDDDEYIYIPHEELNIPELNEDMKFIFIKPISFDILTERIMNILGSGLALSEETLSDILTLSEFIDTTDLDNIANRELKLTLYDKLNLTPKNPDEFLKFMIYKILGVTMVVKNNVLYQDLKHCSEHDKKEILFLLQNYCDNIPNGLEKLSSIYYRNKKIFLSLKVDTNQHLLEPSFVKELNKLINKISKLAKIYHKPQVKQILDDIYNFELDEDILSKLLHDLEHHTTIFREITILNGLSYRINILFNLNMQTDKIIYKIRNGKTFIKDINCSNYRNLYKKYQIVEEHLLHRIKNNIKDKFFYIPDYVDYALPTSEKQFLENIPVGSVITIPKKDNIVYGVHWDNVDNCRIDLDLKQLNKNENYGWDGSYRSSDGKILYSGDMTNPKINTGASEMFYVDKTSSPNSFFITLNHYNATSISKDIPFEFVIATEDKPIKSNGNYIINPNKVIAKFNMKIKDNKNTMSLGIVDIDNEEIKFYLDNVVLFNKNSSGCSTSTFDEFMQNSMNVIKQSGNTRIMLKEVIEDCGGILLDKPSYTSVELQDGKIITADKKVDYDLSLENITKDTFINLLT